MHIKNKLIFDKKILALIIPIALQQLLLSAVGTGDSLMLGFVNGDAMAAASLAANIEFIENLVLAALIGGATILSAQYWGKGDKATIERIFGLILRYAACISVVFTALALAIPSYLMRLFTDEPELISIGAQYIRMAAGSYLLSGITQCFLCIMKTTGQTKQSVLISSFALCLDTVLNAIFIFGLHMQAEGAALTTSITRAIELIIVLIYMRKMAVKPRLFAKTPSALHKDFLHCSVPHLINSLLWGLGTTAYASIIGHLGTAIATAYSAALIVRNLSAALCRGLSQGTEIVVADTLGSGDLPKAKALGREFSGFSVICGIFCAALALLVGFILLRFMELSPQAQDDFQIMIYISAARVLAQCVSMVTICGVFAAGGDTAFDAYSVGVTMWLIIIPLAAAAAFWWKWSPIVVYSIISLDELVKIPWIFAHYKKYKWLNNITKEQPL